MVIVALLCHAGIASALGFGAIRVHSALNEPLDATINLVALTPSEKAGLDVNMASVDMFQRFGIERTAIADRIRISKRDADGDTSRVVLRLTTPRPVREPFLRFLIEAETSAGHALREYTVLLDPPGRAPSLADSDAAAPALSATAPRSTASQSSASSASSASASRDPRPGGDAAPTTNRYGPVAQGETLSRIARRVQRPGTTLDQMQVAIYRDNPEAFGNDMNVLLRGATLTIPRADQIRAIDNSEARSVVRAQRRQAVSRSESANNSEPLAGANTAPTTTEARLRLEAPRSGRSSAQTGGGATGTAGFGRLALPDFSASGPRVAASTTDETPAADEAAPSDPVRAVPGADPMVSPGSSATADDADADADAVPAPDSVDSESSSTPATPQSEASAVNAETNNNSAQPGQAAAGEGAQSSTDTANAAGAGVAEPTTASADAAGDAYQPLPTDAVEVTGRGDGSGALLRPRNLLLLAAALFLVVLLITWNRRRQYRPVPLNFDMDEHESPAAAGARDEEPAPQESVRDEQRSAAAPAMDEAFDPALCKQQADQQMNLGLFDQARDTLEQGLAQAPDDTRLQDKRLELDYRAGDALGFAANIDRFDSQLAGDGVRWAGLASMGRVLLPEDSRFGGEPTAAPATRPEVQSPESLLDGFESDRATSADELAPSAPTSESGYFSLDDTPDGADDSDADTPASDPSLDSADGSGEIEVAGDSDAGDVMSYAPDDGINFYIDDSVAPDTRPDTPRAPVTPIDTTEFDLGDDRDATSEPATTDDSIDVRLDLARMYIDMDDAATARELLEEAVKQGDDDQRAVAQALLTDLQG